MNWKASPPAIEVAASSIAAACLGGAVGFAVARVAPLGAGFVEAVVAGTVIAFAAWTMIGRVDRQRGSREPRFAAATSLAARLDSEDVLLLDQPMDGEILLLDDPPPAIDDEARVVRLFAVQSSDTEATTPLAGPGEMVARIENFLGQDRRVAQADAERRADNPASEDASAALHAALADIRRSLRQG